MAANRKYSGLWMFVAFALALAAFYVKEKREESGAGEKIEADLGEELQQRKGEDEFTPVRITSDKFDVLKNCQLEEHRNNDGDSFHVRHGRDTTEFRLYFVDTPESKYKTYRDGNDNGKRISEQGRYFGGLDRTRTTAVGMAAKQFVLKILRSESFTVVTTGESVYGSEREYAFVVVNWNGKPVYLHELLVAQGLARIHTKPNTMPDNTAASRQRGKLRMLEAEAKQDKRGAWGVE